MVIYQFQYLHLCGWIQNRPHWRPPWCKYRSCPARYWWFHLRHFGTNWWSTDVIKWRKNIKQTDSLTTVGTKNYESWFWVLFFSSLYLVNVVKHSGWGDPFSRMNSSIKPERLSSGRKVCWDLKSPINTGAGLICLNRWRCMPSLYKLCAPLWIEKYGVFIGGIEDATRITKHFWFRLFIQSQELYTIDSLRNPDIRMKHTGKITEPNF